MGGTTDYYSERKICVAAAVGGGGRFKLGPMGHEKPTRKGSKFRLQKEEIRNNAELQAADELSGSGFGRGLKKKETC